MATYLKYTPLYQIGKGTFGKCILARKNGIKYAIKMIDIAADENIFKGALLEIGLLKSLKHRNIVIYEEAFWGPIMTHECHLCIAMEYCPKGDLHDKIYKSENIPFPEETIMSWIVQLFMALDYIHTKGVIHRDIKPQNIFLTSNGVVKLGDFGVAKVLESPTVLASTFCGTPCYIAPEVLLCCKYNHKSDVWSVGCVFYELCTKKTYIFEVRKGTDPFALCAPPYSEEVVGLMRQMLQRDPSLRPSAHEILPQEFLKEYVKEYHEMNQSP